MVAPWCSEQKRGDGVCKSSGRAIGKRAVAASSKKEQWQNRNQKIIQKSNNQPTTVAGQKQPATAVAQNCGIGNAKSGSSSQSSGNNFVYDHSDSNDKHKVIRNKAIINRRQCWW